MTSIDTIEDLVRIIEEQPAWLDRIRNLILTEELIRLPSNVDRLSGDVQKLTSDFGGFADKTDKRLSNLEVGQARLEEGQTKLETSQVRLEARQTKLEAGQARLDRRMDRMTDEMGILKGVGTEAAADRRYKAIAAEFGYSDAELVSVDELYRIASSSVVQDEGRDALRSFRSADLVIRARDTDGAVQYFAVEISYTVNGRDTSRAIRNAEILSRATDVKAEAVVSGYEIDDSVRNEVESGTVFWFQLAPDDMRPR